MGAPRTSDRAATFRRGRIINTIRRMQAQQNAARENGNSVKVETLSEIMSELCYEYGIRREEIAWEKNAITS